MTDFSKPFGANSLTRREPNAAECDQGLPCGQADINLFTGLWHRTDIELSDLQNFTGTVADGTNTTIRRSILALIASVTGAGNTSGFLTVAQATNRFPIFPEINSADNRINVSSPSAGTVRIPSGVEFVHRGAELITTVETDFPTEVSKIYHIRWSPINGYTLNDISDASYNPLGLLEADVSFDSSYDDMLISRIITSSSNVANITNLSNANSLSVDGESVALFSDGSFQDDIPPSQIPFSGEGVEVIGVDFARTPQSFFSGISDLGLNSVEVSYGVHTISRYSLACYFQSDRSDVDGVFIEWAARA